MCSVFSILLPTQVGSYNRLWSTFFLTHRKYDNILEFLKEQCPPTVSVAIYQDTPLIYSIDFNDKAYAVSFVLKWQ